MNFLTIKEDFYKRYETSGKFLHYTSYGALCTLLGHTDIPTAPSLCCTLSMRVEMFARKSGGNYVKNEQAEVEARINEIEYMLKYARVIDDEEIKSDVVTPGSKVVLAIFGGEEKYTIVGSTEADPYKNKLSYESPIGAACLNRAAGETVKANTPGGEIEFKILSIEK